MRRRAALFGSVAIHAACGLALVIVRSTDSKSVEPTARVELAPPTEIELVPLVAVIDSGGGGSPGREATGLAAVHAPQLARVERRRETRSIAQSPTRAMSDAPARSISDSSREKSTFDALAELASASNEVVAGEGGDGGDGGGRGGGHGRGVGRGVGSGLGDRASDGDPLPAIPAAPRASRARPPKLVYPTRERDASEGELYTARVIIDRDGYVVGARIAESHGPKDGDAAAMIFRFRYAPALDDDGRPIKATIDQPFLVQ